MKRLLISLLMVFSLYVPLLAQGWTSATQFGPILLETHFGSLNGGIVVGFDGAVFRTINGGTSWSFVDIKTAANLNDCFFVDGNIGFIAGSSIYKTINSGSTWTVLNTALTTSTFLGIYFTDILKGTAVGSVGTIIRTTDGGTTWTLQTSGTTNGLNSISFIDANTGIIVGDNGEILRTVNGGSTWTPVSAGTLQTLRKVSFFASVGVAVGSSGTILRSTNSGTSWEVQPSNVTSSLQSVHMVNATLGFVVGDNGVLLRTTNGGTIWNPLTPVPTPANQFLGVFFVDATRGTIAANGGTIQRTTDGGTTWSSQVVLFNQTLFGVGFATWGTNSHDAHAVGGIGLYMSSGSRGSFWNSNRLTSKTLRASHGARNAAGDIRIISVGDSGVTQEREINAAGSGGTTIRNSPVNKQLNGIFMVNRDTAYAVGDSGTILRTNNGGSSWSVQTSGTTTNLTSLIFGDANNGLAVGLGGIMRHTTNGGTTWTAVTSGTTNDLRSIYFATGSSIGIVVGASGRILRTTNGGTSWQTVTAPTSNDLNGVHFANSTRGVIVGAGGTILGTNNAGATWTPQQSSSTQTLNAVAFFNDTVGVAVGDLGTILRTTTGVTWVQSNGDRPLDFALAQNYPNPFNPTTTISYNLPVGGKVSLKVYDTNGKEVMTLVQENQSAGQHSTQFVASSHFASGVYFYQLRLGNFSQTKKFVLLK